MCWLSWKVKHRILSEELFKKIDELIYWKAVIRYMEHGMSKEEAMSKADKTIELVWWKHG